MGGVIGVLPVAVYNVYETNRRTDKIREEFQKKHYLELKTVKEINDKFENMVQPPVN